MMNLRFSRGFFFFFDFFLLSCASRVVSEIFRVYIQQDQLEHWIVEWERALNQLRSQCFWFSLVNMQHWALQREHWKCTAISYSDRSLSGFSLETIKQQSMHWSQATCNNVRDKTLCNLEATSDFFLPSCGYAFVFSLVLFLLKKKGNRTSFSFSLENVFSFVFLLDFASDLIELCCCSLFCPFRFSW